MIWRVIYYLLLGFWAYARWLWRNLCWATTKALCGHGLDQSGRWTHRLIPELATWLNRKHGQVGLYLAQALPGHGCFNAYLTRFKKRDDESCRYYRSLVDNAKHTLFVCARWGVTREAVDRAVGAQLTPDTMISLMLQSEQIWMLIESFVTLVIKKRDLDGRAETKRASRNRIEACTRGPASRGGLGCPRRSGEESFYSSPGWRD